LSLSYENDLRKYDDNFRFCLQMSSSNPEKSLVLVHFSLADPIYKSKGVWELPAQVEEETIEIDIDENKKPFYKKPTEPKQ